jgi:hypothetical protein
MCAVSRLERMLSTWSNLGEVARRTVRAARLEAYRVRREQTGHRDPGEPAGVELGSRVPGGAEVILYFADGPENLYQARQWLPVLEQLHGTHRVAVLCRKPASAEALADETEIPVVMLWMFRELESFYETVGAKVCLYVNAHHLNFQSLTFPDQLHVHLNHGESDKISMASNQAKAYDHVLVAGAAAVERYRLNLLRYDGSNLVQVGRPQIDLIPAHRPSADERPTVLYAPTWEGGRAQMDYSSVATMGEAIVSLLVGERYRIVYRPHPKLGASDEVARAAHERILALIAKAGAPHRVSIEEPLGEVFAEADVLIADVSSVVLDFLPTGRPFFVTHPPARQGVLLATASRSDAVGYPLRVEQVPGLIHELEVAMAEDPRRDERLALAESYFGDTTPGASTRRFLEAIDAIVTDRDERIVGKLARLGTD